jgi:hypothetical protein
VEVPFNSTDDDASFFGGTSNFRWKLDVVDGQLVYYVASRGQLSANNKPRTLGFGWSEALRAQQRRTFDFFPMDVDEANKFLNEARAKGVSDEDWASAKSLASSLAGYGLYQDGSYPALFVFP